MNTIKKLFLSSMVCILLFSTVGTAYAEQNSQANSSSFIDVPKSHWAYKEMMYMAENKIITGYGNGYFGAANPITREHLAAFLYRYLKPQDSTNNPFVDIGDSNFKKEILALTARGIFSVNIEKQFNPKNNMTRAEMAAVLVRTFDLKSQGNVEFTDMKGHWANEYVKILAGNQITSGTGDGNFNPNGIVTREQFSMFLYRTIMKVTDTKNDETVGWVVEGEKKYYYDKPGVKQTGLLRSGDDTYLFDKNGNLASGWNTVDGKDYYFDRTTGAAQKGWFPQATHWYFANDEGAIQKGDVTYKGKQFQFDRTGKMVKGWVKIRSFDHNIYSSRTVLRGYNPIQVGDDETLEVVGEDGPLWFRVNYNGKTYVVKKLFVVVFDQSLSNKMDEIRQEVDDLKFGLELIQKHSKRLADANQAKNIDTAMLESSELAQSMNHFITTLKGSHLKSFVDKISEREADPNVQVKYQSTLTNLQMMEEDFSKIHKFMLLKDSVMVLNKAAKDSGDIIGNVEAAKKLVPDTLYNAGELTVSGIEMMVASLDASLGFPLEINEQYIEPMEKYFKSLPQDELKKQVNGLKDTATEIKDWHEDFKGRIPAYKSMAKDLHTFNKSVDKFAKSVDTAAKSLHKQALMAEDLTRSVSTHIKEAQQAFPTLHTDIMSGIDATNHLLDSANKIAGYKIDTSNVAKNVGNMDGLTNRLKDFGVPPEKMKEYLEEQKRTNELGSIALDFIPVVGQIKQGLQVYNGREFFTEKEYGPNDYVWGTVSTVLGGSPKVIGRVFGKYGELEQKAKDLGKVSKVTEEIGWSMPRGGGVIDGRKYSEHALERMAPDTIQVRAELTKRARERAERKGYSFGSKDYVKELKGVDPRGMTPNVVEDIIKTGSRQPGDKPGTWKYVREEGYVVLNDKGDVITVVPAKKKE
ncbi:S-layer homology domain-containing protein [Bacillus wiedmannii]|uniref:S-layer homology domain-containing protein n=1 Tax=Bacillus wiedmannii TaxID=1890302 RepID=UPI000BF972A0|nr:S-layer homology domain-containing protein [Bacillus wiedmannii]PFZ89001.1 S-layer protein [Bacillus wiedmannii]